MEISIGEYVRTDNGEIHKVEDEEDLGIHIKTEKIMFRAWVEDYYGCHKEDRFIVKHSKDIIDLIEKNDYVNGHLVIHKYTDTYYGQVILIEKALAEAEEKFLKNKDIKSVITAEQIKQIEFRIKE